MTGSVLRSELLKKVKYATTLSLVAGISQTITFPIALGAASDGSGYVILINNHNSDTIEGVVISARTQYGFTIINNIDTSTAEIVCILNN